MIDFTVPLLLQKLSMFNVQAKALTQQQQNTINQVIDYLERQATKQGAQDDSDKRSI
jgi:ribosome-associated translation inhibitor RaiA